MTTLYTEAEAREKWCPFVRMKSGMTSFNRELLLDENGKPVRMSTAAAFCIGSSCMQWVWRGGHPPRRKSFSYPGERVEEPPRMDYVPPEYVWNPEVHAWEEPLEDWQKRRTAAVGGCGLAADILE